MATRKISRGKLVELKAKTAEGRATCPSCAMFEAPYGCTTVDYACMNDGNSGKNWHLIDANPEIMEVDGKTYYHSMKLPQCSGDWIEFTDPDKGIKNRHYAKENN